MNAFRHDLSALIGKHLTTLPAEKLLQVMDQLDSAVPAAIKAGDSSIRFINLDEDGHYNNSNPRVAVLDIRTGLEWSADIIGTANWKDAQKLAGECRLLGHSDWRLPTVQELLGLIDYGRHGPAVDPAHFTGEFGWTWSGTPYAGDPSGCAWGVGLRGGNACWSGQGSRGHVRAVRASQSHGLTE